MPFSSSSPGIPAIVCFDNGREFYSPLLREKTWAEILAAHVSDHTPLRTISFEERKAIPPPG